jgi:hypothetical protein
MHFNVAASEDDKLAGFFAQLDSRATELGIVDVQAGARRPPSKKPDTSCAVSCGVGKFSEPFRPH